VVQTRVLLAKLIMDVMPAESTIAGERILNASTMQALVLTRLYLLDPLQILLFVPSVNEWIMNLTTRLVQTRVLLAKLIMDVMPAANTIAGERSLNASTKENLSRIMLMPPRLGNLLLTFLTDHLSSFLHPTRLLAG
jgi:hypothetical protein